MHSDCDCGENCEIPDITDQQYHDCSVAEKIFKQLDTSIIQKLHDSAQFTFNVSYQLFDFGAATVTLDIKPKQDPLYKDEEIKVRTLLRDDLDLTDSDEFDYVDIDTGKIVPRPLGTQVHRNNEITRKSPRENKVSLGNRHKLDERDETQKDHRLSKRKLTKLARLSK